MKIIHTADWHLGQTISSKSRYQEHLQFIEWLLKYATSENVDLIIVAGDIFDVSNPAIEAIDLYHYFLVHAFQNKIEVIIIGGNHDSASRLNTTSKIFKQINVHVIGGDSESIYEIIPVSNKSTDKIECVVVAVPYLRDGDIRQIELGENISDSAIRYEQAVKKLYSDALEKAKNLYPNLPIITTAHLYVLNSSVSDTKREMHTVGTLGKVSASVFDRGYSYVAMGHIHKPQTLVHSDSIPVRYAGSPISLSFSERDDLKEITLLNFVDEKLNFESVYIPANRLLKRFEGSQIEIKNSIQTVVNTSDLPIWAEIIVTEKIDTITFKTEIEELAKNANMEIHSYKSEIPKDENQVTGLRDNFKAGTDNTPLDNIEDVFNVRCKKSNVDDVTIDEIKPLFLEIVKEIKEGVLEKI